MNDWKRHLADQIARTRAVLELLAHRLHILAKRSLLAAGSLAIRLRAAFMHLLALAVETARTGIAATRIHAASLTAYLASLRPILARVSARWASIFQTNWQRTRAAIVAAWNRKDPQSASELQPEPASKRANRIVPRDLAAILPQPPGTPLQRMRLLVATAFAVVGVFIIGFGVWATFAPLESAAIAGGAIEAETSRKTIQHLEGGIIQRILVADGDEVAAGQPLIRLDDTKAHATVQMLQMQLWDAQALEARLLAERGAHRTIQFPLTIRPVAKDEPALAEIISGQMKIFDTRRKLQASRIEVIQQRIAQTKQEIAGLRFQEQAATKRSAIISDEIAVVAPLVAKRLQARQRLSLLEREQAEVDGRIGDTRAQIARAEQSIGESQATILKLESDRQTEIAQELRDTRARIFELVERINAASDVLARTVVRAPEAGTVTDLRIHTPGGVIAAGEPLLDLVPAQDRLIVRAQVKPEDIDLVRPGLDARVRLLSYKHRRVPPVDGVLTYVSADRLVERETDRTYYTARIRISEASLHALPEVEIMPGMPVEVLIKTGQFTVAHYALRPVLDSFNRAFRED